MSVEALWDLGAPASPRSLCVYAASADDGAGSTTNNPFEAGSIVQQQEQRAIAVVYGTLLGSLHLRTFAPPSGSQGSSSFSASPARGSTASSSAQLQLPLGVTTPSGGGKSPPLPPVSTTNVPRAYHPVNLSQGAFGGSIVSCVPMGGAVGQQLPQHAVFLVLVDDQKPGGGGLASGAWSAHTVALAPGSSWNVLTFPKSAKPLPRMSCATYHPATGLVYAAHRSVKSLSSEHQQQIWAALEAAADAGGQRRHYHPQHRAMLKAQRPSIVFDFHSLPSPGARSGGADALTLTCAGRVAVVAVANTFYAVPGQESEDVGVTVVDSKSPSSAGSAQQGWVRLLSFSQSSQVHPVVVLDLQDPALDAEWSSLFLASGRECAIVDVWDGPVQARQVTCTPPRHGSVTLMASPILSAAFSWPWLAILTSDGLVSIRSPSCLNISLRTVEVGTRPNDYFCLQTFLRSDISLSSSSSSHHMSLSSSSSQLSPWILAAAYSGECKILRCRPDTAQDLADRLMRYAIDAFGANGFPRAELAQALNASFTATSYVGPEPCTHSRLLLKQYLEAVLGLADFESGGTLGWPTELSAPAGSVGGGGHHHGSFDAASRGGRGAPPTVLSSESPAALLTGTALLCLVCRQLTPPQSSLASRSAKSCIRKMGVIVPGSGGGSAGDLSEAAVNVCELVADTLLRESASSFSLLSGSSATPTQSPGMNRTQLLHAQTEFVEAVVYLLRSCGKHERAIDVAYERLQQHGGPEGSTGRGVWSQIKYESYMATHLSELCSSGKDAVFRLVLQSPATHRLLENNPRLGLSVFTSTHPETEEQWRVMLARDDPLAHPEHAASVLKLLKSINPSVPYEKDRSAAQEESNKDVLPLNSGRALAVSFLESAIGISSGRPADEDEFDNLAPDENFEERIANFHDELSFLLLEGVISERREEEKNDDEDSELGAIYRRKLRRLLRWPLARIRSDQFMNSLPSSFLQEKALLLGRMGRHEDALRILYRDLHSLELALEYCDSRYEQQKARLESARARQQYHESGIFAEQVYTNKEDNAYLPLVRVALESEDKERGTTAAIQVLALRRGAIDRAAALRLLPQDVPVSAVARPFLIPALVDSESQERRLTVVSALLRARYLRLKEGLTAAQLKAQSNLHVVPQLRSLGLGDPLHSTKAFRARPSATANPTMPDVMIVKYFFPRHLVIQAKVTNSSGQRLSSDKNQGRRTLADIAFVVAESSEEAISPLLQVPIKFLPPDMTGSAWCVLSAIPQRMEGSICQLTCELRYTVQDANAAIVSPTPSQSGAGVLGRTYVEELSDLEVHASHFS